MNCRCFIKIRSRILTALNVISGHKLALFFLAQAGVGGFSAVKFQSTGILNKTDLISCALDVLMVLDLVLIIYQARLWRLRNLILRFQHQLSANSKNFLGSEEAKPLLRFFSPSVMCVVIFAVWYFLKTVAASLI